MFEKKELLGLTTILVACLTKKINLKSVVATVYDVMCHIKSWVTVVSVRVVLPAFFKVLDSVAISETYLLT